MVERPAWLIPERYAYLRNLDAGGWANALVSLANRLDGDSWKDGWEDILPDIPDLQPAYIGPPTVYKWTPGETMMRGTVPLCVNLLASDEDIARHMMKVISELREEAGLPSPNNQRGREPVWPNDSFSKTRFGSWIDHQIIPLGELLVWRKKESSRVTKTQLGHWLFPKHDQPARRINQAEAVLRKAIDSIPALWAQADGQVSEVMPASDQKE